MFVWVLHPGRDLPLAFNCFSSVFHRREESVMSVAAGALSYHRSLSRGKTFGPDALQTDAWVWAAGERRCSRPSYSAPWACGQMHPDKSEPGAFASSPILEYFEYTSKIITSSSKLRLLASAIPSRGMSECCIMNKASTFQDTCWSVKTHLNRKGSHLHAPKF